MENFKHGKAWKTNTSKGFPIFCQVFCLKNPKRRWDSQTLQALNPAIHPNLRIRLGRKGRNGEPHLTATREIPWVNTVRCPIFIPRIYLPGEFFGTFLGVFWKMSQKIGVFSGQLFLWVVARAHLSRTSCLLSLVESPAEDLLFTCRDQQEAHSQVNPVNPLSSSAHPSSRTAMRNSSKIIWQKRRALRHVKAICSPLGAWCTLWRFIEVFICMQLFVFRSELLPLGNFWTFLGNSLEMSVQKQPRQPHTCHATSCFKAFSSKTWIYLNTMGHCINDNEPFLLVASFDDDVNLSQKCPGVERDCHLQICLKKHTSPPPTNSFIVPGDGLVTWSIFPTESVLAIQTSRSIDIIAGWRPASKSLALNHFTLQQSSAKKTPKFKMEYENDGFSKGTSFFNLAEFQVKHVKL